MSSPYRVEQQEDKLWHLFIRRPDGSEFEFGNGYEHQSSARYDGYVSTLKKATTDDGVRMRRRLGLLR